MTFHSGAAIEKLCEVQYDDHRQMRPCGDKSGMVRAARALLSSVTRVLLLADTVVVKQLLAAKDKVCVVFFSFLAENRCHYLK